jgi:hypothetical protein
MKRLLLNPYEQIVYDDLNNIQMVMHQSVQERFLYNLLQQQNGVLGSSFLPSKASSLTVNLNAGSAFYYDSTQTGYEPKYREIYSSTALTATISTPHATLPRWDIVCIAPQTSITATAQRYVKTGGTGPIVQQTINKISENTVSLQVVAGTPNASPTVPATPAGYIKLSEVYVTAVSGIVNASDVWDRRTVLLPAMPKVLGDRWVAPSGLGTDMTLAAAIAALPSGGIITLGENVSLGSSSTTINNSNILIQARPGVTLSGTGTGLVIAASYTRIRGVRFSGFSTAISISNTYNTNFITECSFASCTNEVVDNNTTANNMVAMNISE